MDAGLGAAFQLAFNAAALGAAYALIALGFVLVINAIGTVNFAHGHLVMAGGFVAVALSEQWAVPGIVLLPAVFILMALLGAILHFIAYRPLSSAPPEAIFVSTIAFGLILEHGAASIFGAAPRAGPSLIGTGSIPGLGVDRQSTAVLLTALLSLVALNAVLHRTQIGRRMRACAADPEMARAIGIPVARMTALSFAAAAALAGIAGLLLSHQFYVTAVDGNALMLKAYIAVVLGGWGRVGGALAGAFIVAAFEAGLAAWLSHPIAEGALYVAVLLVLLFRPHGLFGETLGRRV